MFFRSAFLAMFALPLTASAVPTTPSIAASGVPSRRPLAFSALASSAFTQGRSPRSATPTTSFTRVSQRQAPTAALYVPEGVHFHSWLGFLGGTCGVVGTLLTYETKRFRMKQRVRCPYCEGGVLTCGVCLGSGEVQEVASGATHTCPNCGGLGVRACVNCKGEGLSIPIVLQRKKPEIPVSEFELAVEDLGIAAVAANYVNTRARQRLDREVARHAELIRETDSELQDRVKQAQEQPPSS